MKCSELISKLQNVISSTGDIDVCLSSKYMGSFTSEDIDDIMVITLDINGIYRYVKLIGEFENG